MGVWLNVCASSMVRLGVILLAVMGLSLIATPKRAQAQQISGFQLEHFEPLAAQGKNRLGVASTDVMPHLSPSFGIWTHVAADQLVVVGAQTQTRRASIVSQQIRAELQSAIGFLGWLELDMVFPMVPYQAGDVSESVGLGEAVTGFSIADPRVMLRATLLDADNELVPGLGAGVALGAYLPLGDPDTLQSDGRLRLEPRLMVDWRHASGLWFGGNVAYQLLRSKPQVRNFAGGDTARWALGVQLPTGLESLSVLGSVLGQVSIGTPADSVYDSFDQSSPIEGQLGAQWLVDSKLVAQLGFGAGLNQSIGAPSYRVFFGLSYTPMKAPRYDQDQDGVLDLHDMCPKVAEDVDGYMDSDGCPDLDNDADGIVDKVDVCPDEPEDRDGFKDADGCPDPDNDNDGVLDDEDRCPVAAGIPALKGCPAQDSDQDKVADDEDLCPEIPEDLDGFEDDDGCPDPDNDGDGILDKDDDCPDEAGSSKYNGCLS